MGKAPKMKIDLSCLFVCNSDLDRQTMAARCLKTQMLIIGPMILEDIFSSEEDIRYPAGI